MNVPPVVYSPQEMPRQVATEKEQQRFRLLTKFRKVDIIYAKQLSKLKAEIQERFGFVPLLEPAAQAPQV